MSFTLFGLATIVLPAALDAIGNYARENRGVINGLLKESKPLIHDAPKLLDDELQKLDKEIHKHEYNGWDKDK